MFDLSLHDNFAVHSQINWNQAHFVLASPTGIKLQDDALTNDVMGLALLDGLLLDRDVVIRPEVVPQLCKSIPVMQQDEEGLRTTIELKKARVIVVAPIAMSRVECKEGLIQLTTVRDVLAFCHELLVKMVPKRHQVG